MKISTAIITIFLIFGLLGVPSGVFAQEASPTGSDSASQYSTSIVLDNMVPLLKVSRGSSSSSSSKKLKIDTDDDDSDASGDPTGGDGSGWLITIIILIVIIAIIAIAVWYFFLRK
jgi:hypothetical protein